MVNVEGEEIYLLSSKKNIRIMWIIVKNILLWYLKTSWLRKKWKMF